MRLAPDVGGLPRMPVVRLGAIFGRLQHASECGEQALAQPFWLFELSRMPLQHADAGWQGVAAPLSQSLHRLACAPVASDVDASSLSFIRPQAPSHLPQLQAQSNAPSVSPARVGGAGKPQSHFGSPLSLSSTSTSGQTAAGTHGAPATLQGNTGAARNLKNAIASTQDAAAKTQATSHAVAAPVSAQQLHAWVQAWVHAWASGASQGTNAVVSGKSPQQLQSYDPVTSASAMSASERLPARAEQLVAQDSPTREPIAMPTKVRRFAQSSQPSLARVGINDNHERLPLRAWAQRDTKHASIAPTQPSRVSLATKAESSAGVAQQADVAVAQPLAGNRLAADQLRAQVNQPSAAMSMQRRQDIVATISQRTEVGASQIKSLDSETTPQETAPQLGQEPGFGALRGLLARWQAGDRVAATTQESAAAQTDASALPSSSSTHAVANARATRVEAQSHPMTATHDSRIARAESSAQLSELSSALGLLLRQEARRFGLELEES